MVFVVSVTLVLYALVLFSRRVPHNSKVTKAIYVTHYAVVVVLKMSIYRGKPRVFEGQFHGLWQKQTKKTETN